MNETDRPTKHRMLYEALRKDILSGRFDPPKSFPSEMQLMRRFKLSRITVRRALEELGRQGFITSRQGAGTYVTRLGAAHRIGLIMPGIAYSEFYQPLVGEILHQSASAGYELILNDIQLTGFDDIRIASLVSPPLTTIHQPCADIARTAFHRLLARIANPALPPTELLLPSPLVVRASTRR